MIQLNFIALHQKFLYQIIVLLQVNEQILAALNSKTDKGIVIETDKEKNQGQYFILIPKSANDIQTYPYTKQTVVNYSVK